MQNVISQQNAQVAELKRLHKAFHAKQLQAMQLLRTQTQQNSPTRSIKKDLSLSASERGGELSSVITGAAPPLASSFLTKASSGGSIHKTSTSSEKLKEKGEKEGIQNSGNLPSKSQSSKSSLLSSSYSSNSKSKTTLEKKLSNSSGGSGENNKNNDNSSNSFTRPSVNDSEISLDSIQSMDDISDLSLFFKASIEEIESFLNGGIEGSGIEINDYLDELVAINTSDDVIRGSTFLGGGEIGYNGGSVGGGGVSRMKYTSKFSQQKER